MLKTPFWRYGSKVSICFYSSHWVSKSKSKQTPPLPLKFSYVSGPRLNSPDSSMTPEDYRLQFWGELRDAIDQMLSHPPGSYKPISYEQMYSAVYKCVCKQYSEQLYADLITHIRTRLVEMSKILNDVSDNQFISEFHKALVQYFHALGGIVPIFTYMNRYASDCIPANSIILFYSGFTLRPSSTLISRQS